MTHHIFTDDFWLNQTSCEVGKGSTSFAGKEVHRICIYLIYLQEQTNLKLWDFHEYSIQFWMVIHQISMVPTILLLQSFYTTAIHHHGLDLVESHALYLRTGKSIPKVLGPKKNSVTYRIHQGMVSFGGSGFPLCIVILHKWSAPECSYCRCL